jgi:hypothetical protein
VTAKANELLILATEGAEGLSGDHIASKLAVPIGILIFCGAVYLLLWSNYGAKKGALIYGTAFFGFCAVLGVFWWFGAPGTPVATGLQNFPGQAADAYQAKWYPFEPGSERAAAFPDANDLGSFQPVDEFLGLGGQSPDELESDPMYAATNGDVTQASQLMVDVFLRIGEDGNVGLGGERRTAYQDDGFAMLVDEFGADAAEEFTRGEPFFSAEPDTLLMTRDQGTLLTGAEIVAYVNFAGPDGQVRYAVDSQPVFAFKTPDLLWLPSAVWTIVSLLLFGVCLFALDRIEQREKRMVEEAEEPERLAVPIRQ